MVVQVASTACDHDDEELERLLMLELADLPELEHGFTLQVELRCATDEIEMTVRDPARNTSLRRTIESPEAALGRERVLALAIRQLVDRSFIEIVSGARAPPSEPTAVQREAPDRASEPARNAEQPLDEPTPAAPPQTAELDESSGPAAWLGVELGSLGRALETRPVPALRLGLRGEMVLGRRWSVITLLAGDWTTVAELGGRVHAFDLDVGLGGRARFAVGQVFSARVGADVELGWGRVFGLANSGFDAGVVDGIVVQGRGVAGVWATGKRGEMGVDVVIGGGARTPVGTVAGSETISLGGVFAGMLIGGSWMLPRTH
jgi:hypothetical protein